MMRRFMIAALCSTVAVPAAAQSMADLIEARALMRQAATELAQGRLQQHADRIAAVLRLRPDYPAAIYAAAQANARLRQREPAIEQLFLLADMGIAVDPAADTLFKSFAHEPAFTSLLERFKRNAQPLGRARLVDSFGEPDLLPDGITFDSKRNRTCLAGVHLRKVTCKTRNGETVDLGTRAGLWSVLAVAFDESRGSLWLTTAALPQTRNLEPRDSGRTALIELDPGSDRVLQRYEPGDSAAHSFGDLAVAPNGEVWVSDGGAATIYRVRRGRAQLEPVVRLGSFPAPQGITFTPDGRDAFVADYARGIFRIDPVNGASTQIRAPQGTTLLGVDGLTFHRNSLIAIQNGIRPHRVIHICLEETRRHATRVDVLEANHPDFMEPTVGVMIGDEFHFVANSQWPLFPAGTGRTAPKILSLRVPQC